MKIGITYKLLFTFFFTSLVVVGSMLFLMNWSFERGFLQYVNTAEIEARNILINQLEDLYRKHGNWDFLKNNRRRWHELHFSSFMQTEAAKSRLHMEDEEEIIRAEIKNMQEKFLRETMKEPEDFSTERIPPVNKFRDRLEQRITDWHNEWHKSHDHENKKFRPHQNEHRRRIDRHFRASNVLLDENKQAIVGKMDSLDDLKFQEIKVSGNVVAYLGIKPRRQLSNIHDLRFSEEQGRIFLYIALFALLISMIMALPLSHNLVSPVRSLTLATRKLAAGNYKSRASVSTNDELGQLSRDFNTLARSLEQHEKARRQWIADISHELRTPLAVLRGEIEAIQDGIREFNPERLQSLHNEIMNLNRLVEDLYELSMSDIGALSYQKASVDMNKVLEQSIALFQDDYKSKNIQLQYSYKGMQPVNVFADEKRLQQLFSNLLTNSLRYTDTGGKMLVELEMLDKHCIVRFMDSAPGVSDGDMKKLFDRLFRVDSSRSRESGGTGLGLAICRNITDAHDATINAEQSPLGGLAIVISWPLDK